MKEREMAERLTKAERNARDELLLAALESLSFGVEWVDADQVARAVYGSHRTSRAQASVIGIGRVLSRIAREGRIEVDDASYMNRYRSLDFRRAVPAIGEVLVPKDTPAGPADARVGWARAVGTLRTVLGVERDGLDVAFEQGSADEGDRGEMVLSTEELAAGYERPDGKAIGCPGES